MTVLNRESVFKIIEENPKLSGFDLWYRCYPKHKSKGDARKAWIQTAKDRLPIEEMLATLEKQKHSDDWYRDSGQWIPYPASYLRAWMFLDE